MYQRILTGAVLAVCSVTDLRSRRICGVLLAVYPALALLGHLTGRTAAPAELALGLLPGGFCLLVSWVSRGGLGWGDSFLILGCGLSTGLWPCLGILFCAFLLSGLWAAVLLVFFRAGRKREIPFVPFLFLGMLAQWAGGMAG